MALLNDTLSVWEIGFRWAGYDPAGVWWRIPLPVRDNFRVLMDAILQAHLECVSLSMRKGPSEDFDLPPEFFIRYHLDEVEACIAGRTFNRRLLRFAQIERPAFQDWCERHAIPLPEFWFPPGWSDYRWPSEDPEDAAKDEEGVAAAVAGSPAEDRDRTGLRPVQRARIACQQIARALWKTDPTLTIAAMVERDEIQRLGGAASWVPEVVRRWLSEVDERDPNKKRGRRKGS
jgi:hypothetical protein